MPLQNAPADRAPVPVDPPWERPAVQLAAGRHAGVAELGAVSEGQALDREADVYGLVSQDAVEVLGIDLEVRRGDLDGGAAEAPAVPLDDGASGAAQSTVPLQRNRRPDAEVQRATHRVEGSLIAQIQVARCQHVDGQPTAGGGRDSAPRACRHRYHGAMSYRLRFAVLLLTPLLAHCGESGGLDRSQYQSVFDAAMRAVARRDLQALDPLLSEEGRRRLQATLGDFQHRLQDPVQGKLILDLVEERRGPVDTADLDEARHGSLEAAWRFLLFSDPRPEVPDAQASRPLPGGDGVVVEYADPRGTLRTVTLRPQDGVWAIDDLQL